MINTQTVALYLALLYHATIESLCNDNVIQHDADILYTNIVLEGGGIRGISYVGALRAFEEYGYYASGRYKFLNVTGTSVGCLFGLLIALDISPTDLNSLVNETDFRNLFNANVVSLLNVPMRENTSSFGFFDRVKYYYQWLVYAFRAFAIWYENIFTFGISDDTNLMLWLGTKVLPLSIHKVALDDTLETLSDRTGHELTCFSTRLYDVAMVRINSKTNPQATIRETLYASVTLPLVFQPIHDSEGFPLVDGGLLNNFPIYEHDTRDYRSEETIGLSLNEYPFSRFVSPSPPPKASDISFFSHLISSFMNLVFTPDSKTATKTACNGKCDFTRGTKPKRPETKLHAHNVSSSMNYIKSMLDVVMNERDRIIYSNDPRNCDRVIYLNSPLHFMELDASKEKISLAVDRGYEAVRKFLRFRDKISIKCFTDFV